MELPRALQPWHEQLSIFPPDLAVALGGIVDNLSLLFGPMLSPDAAGRGEPDGVGGIGRRGSFERLLSTEWALAEEAPLEFLRRVSTNELSFLEIAHQKPTVARQSIVLFDVGPDQRGGPRVVHLAVLILLAQRAFVGGASFSWGFLQDEPCELYFDVNEESVRRLVQATSNRRANVTDAERWQEAIGKDAAEVWIVGGATIGNVGGETFPLRVEIEDSVDPAKPFDVCVDVFSGRKEPRSVRLALPPSGMSVRLIRDPFQVARATPKKASQGLHPETNIVFTKTGKLLFVRGANGELITVPIPNSPNVPEPPKPRVFVPPDGQMLIGVGQMRLTNRIAAVTQTTHEFIVHTLSKRYATTASEEKFIAFTSGNGFTLNPQGPLGVLYSIDDQGFYLQNGFSVLFELAREDMRATYFQNAVLSAYHDGGDFYYCRVDDDDVRYLVRCWGNQSKESVLPGWSGETSQVVVGPATLVIRNSKHEAIVITNSDGHPHCTRNFEPGAEVVGLKLANNPGILVVDPSRRRISLIDQDGEKTWLTAPGRIRTAAAIAGCWLVALITEDDELCVYANEHKNFVLRLHMGAS